MSAISSDVVFSLDLQTGLEVAGEVLVTFQEPHPGVLGAGILHLVNPAIRSAQYCQRILERGRHLSSYLFSHVSTLTYIEEGEVLIAGGETLRLHPGAEGGEVLLHQGDQLGRNGGRSRGNYRLQSMAGDQVRS